MTAPVAKKYQEEVNKRQYIINNIMSLNDKKREKLEKKLRLLIQENFHDNKKASVIGYYIGLSKIRKNKTYKTYKPENVSDHAVVRYLERVMNIDTETIRRKIFDDALRKNIDVRVKKSMIVTVIKKNK